LKNNKIGEVMIGTQHIETATLAGGCFWCLEAVFQQTKGVLTVQSGYSGGHITDPNYHQVCTGTTGHAEVVQVTYNSDELTFSNLLEIFFEIHDPTTLNQQGPDTGTQYRSAIFYTNENQKELSEELITNLDATKKHDSHIVTEVTPLGIFYPAEDYHNDYYKLNMSQPYCQFIIEPKLLKFRKSFPNKFSNSLK
jgi:peptide-methionine (S)-S-oxide reductase